jgi:hypothetical protein
MAPLPLVVAAPVAVAVPVAAAAPVALAAAVPEEALPDPLPDLTPEMGWPAVAQACVKPEKMGRCCVRRRQTI